MTLVGKLHASSVFPRRVRRLAELIAGMLPENASVLDIGSGDGSIDALIMSKRSDVRIAGVDVLIRPETKVPTRQFDGRHIPFNDRSFDVAMFVDVLHHTDCSQDLLREANRVSKQGVLIKDHFLNGALSKTILRFMDYVGNAHHAVRLPYNYISPEEWTVLYRTAGLRPIRTVSKLHLYPWPASLVFDDGLHFLTMLQKTPGMGRQATV